MRFAFRQEGKDDGKLRDQGLFKENSSACILWVCFISCWFSYICISNRLFGRCRLWLCALWLWLQFSDFINSLCSTHWLQSQDPVHWHASSSLLDIVDVCIQVLMDKAVYPSKYAVCLFFIHHVNHVPVYKHACNRKQSNVHICPRVPHLHSP